MKKYKTILVGFLGITVGFIIGLLLNPNFPVPKKVIQTSNVPDSIVQRQEIAYFSDTQGIEQEVLVVCYNDHIELKPKSFFNKTFEDFNVKIENINSVPIDYNSNKIAKQFKTVISEQYVKGINFAGHYSITEWGCGSNCFETAITDIKTGKVYAGPTSYDVGGVRFDRQYIDFRPDSKLIIINPPDSLGFYDQGMFDKPGYYLWENNKLIRLTATNSNVWCHAVEK